MRHCLCGNECSCTSFLSDQHLWHTREETETAKRAAGAEKPEKQVADEAYWKAAEEREEALRAAVARMFNSVIVPRLAAKRAEEVAAAEEAAIRLAQAERKDAQLRKAAAVRLVGSLGEHSALPQVDVDAVLAANVYDSSPPTPLEAMQPAPQPLRRRWSSGYVRLQGEYWERRHVLGL